MSRSLVLIIYNLLLPVFFIVAFPAWLLKMWRRGGYGSGLLERFGKFSTESSSEPRDVVYLHAVSVGEVFIALKLINQWSQKEPDLKFVLAATTSTGHAVARENAPDAVRVIYSPLDFGWIVRSVMRRFGPRQLVLIEAEVWPNLVNMVRRMGIPLAMVNARLSRRSEKRFMKYRAWVQPWFEMLDLVCVQDEGDAKRFEALGIPAANIHVTGSIKFDPAGGKAPSRRAEFQTILDDFAHDAGVARPVVLIASSHAGEEKLIADALLKSGSDALLVVVPRHAERRSEVVAELESSGFEVVLRSQYHAPRDDSKACLVIDVTGELCDWTAHADIVVIGKSWLAQGGQNPAEAIMAGVPVITGPHMGNFEPLVTALHDAEAITMLSDPAGLASSIKEMLEHPELAGEMSRRALDVLTSHKKAVQKTIQLLDMNASVSQGNMQKYHQDHE
ncbi:MAG: 3-deoxy-D-manno-octulosonic acid transferase [Akkermansiaceae bacterium]